MLKNISDCSYNDAVNDDDDDECSLLLMLMIACVLIADAAAVDLPYVMPGCRPPVTQHLETGLR